MPVKMQVMWFIGSRFIKFMVIRHIIKPCIQECQVIWEYFWLGGFFITDSMPLTLRWFYRVSKQKLGICNCISGKQKSHKKELFGYDFSIIQHGNTYSKKISSQNIIPGAVTGSFYREVFISVFPNGLSLLGICRGNSYILLAFNWIVLEYCI